MSYERTVSAALAETQDKFKLAEALALDIPPARRGPTAEDEQSVSEYLDEARERIIEAGGEPRSANTLAAYRLTALWVSTQLGRNFRWLPGVSFSAHREARAAGESYDYFAANPRTVDEVRRDAGWTGTDGQPSAIAARWTPEQKAEVASDLLSDPEVVTEVMKNPEVRQAVVKAQVSQYREDHERDIERMPPSGAIEEINSDLFDIRWKLKSIHERQPRLRAMDRPPVADSLEVIGRQSQMIADIVRNPDAGRVTDEALADLLSGGK